MTNDVFPKATTLVRQWLNQGADSRRELLRYLMEIYARPLSIYYLGCSYRDLGEPEDIVHGFFISYLSRAGYLEKWQASGKRLRHWLANGLLFHCRDRLNDTRRHRGEPIDDSEPVMPPPETQRRFESEVTGQFVRMAMARAEQMCASKELKDHWRLFELYHLRGVALESLASDQGLDSVRAWVMVRTAERNFKKALRDVIAGEIDSADPADIDREIESML